MMGSPIEEDVMRVTVIAVSLVLAFPAFALALPPGQSSVGAPASQATTTGATDSRRDLPATRDFIPNARPVSAREKIARLKTAGIRALPDQLGTPFVLDMVTPYAANKGNLYLVRPGDSSHQPGGFASFRITLHISDEGPAFDVVPGALLQLKADAQHHLLVDCHVAEADGFPMEFQIAPAVSWWDAPVSSTTVAVQSSHVYMVVPKGASEPWKYVRLRAAQPSPRPNNFYWRFVGCNITPVGP
jgi:hypothetical protein